MTGPSGQPDGAVVAGDALAIINYINAFGAGRVPANAPIGPPYYDTVDSTAAPAGDDFVAPGDALAIINFINAFGPGISGPAGEGEGQATLAGIESTASQPSMPGVIALLALDVASQPKRRRA